MKFYLSSYLFGDRIEELKTMLPENARIGIISNAKDGAPTPGIPLQNVLTEFHTSISNRTEVIDLKEYFGKQELLGECIKNLDLLRVTGGNTYVLLDAMRLSWLDNILQELFKNNHPLVYGGDSAGVCVLAPTMQWMEIIDEPELNPYGTTRTLWENGLQLLDYMVIPHYKSTYNGGNMGRKTELMEKYLQENHIAYKPLQDGEVIIID